MATQKPKNPALTELSREACWAHLRTAVLGRLAVAGREHPELFPINYLVDRGTVLFRTDPGTKLAASMDKALVTFEVDGYLPDTHEAWSVVVKGTLEPVLETAEVVDAVALPLFPWQGGAKAFFVRIVPDVLSGRRFAVADPSQWVSPLTGIRRSAEE
ncbi:pyridoxamine 5'-phosphate oxidase family protein [Sinomonas sp. P47F7]|uniref:pyridoxamine 5'-phosphate oxidase family protein n=1 Tax=Sinomonas sp. P47F7 TaxID=3410987 RepID=UPI003BF52942